MTKPVLPAKVRHAAANASGCVSRWLGRPLRKRRPPKTEGGKNPSETSGLARWLRSLLALCIAGGAAAAEAEDAPLVQLDTTVGEIRIRLFPDKAPRTVRNFLRLAEDGFYDGLIFHRVLANFVIQAGGYDAEMNRREPPGAVANESFNGLRNRRGTVAMARLADPDSADAQFFINLKDNAHLDAKPGQPGYTVFGEVVSGMDAVTAIELSDTEVRQGMAGVPRAPIIINRLTRIGDQGPG